MPAHNELSNVHLTAQTAVTLRLLSLQHQYMTLCILSNLIK